MTADHSVLSLSAQTYATIRRRIIVGHYPQGARLPEAKLAAELDVSRIPLRAAIPQLEVDGFVHTLPRRGAVVNRWDERAVNDLFDVRVALEPAAARHAAERVQTGASTQPLLDAIEDSHVALRQHDALEIARTSTVIHERIVELAGNELLTTLMKAVSGRVNWLFYLTSQRDPDLACQEHHELHDVILSGNARLAEAVAFQHIEAGRLPSIQALA
jgi:DNA-binding GntR family transcriptional regulator